MDIGATFDMDCLRPTAWIPWRGNRPKEYVGPNFFST
jgi:hypothetical protein